MAGVTEEQGGLSQFIEFVVHPPRPGKVREGERALTPNATSSSSTEPPHHGSNDGYPDWWDQAVEEVMEEIRQKEGWPAPKANGDNGKSAPSVP